jgi:multiple sugar transport system permease protein
MPVARPKPKTMWQRMVKHRYEYLYVAPALGVMALVILYPLIYTIILSFFDTPVDRPEIVFTGLDNYAELLTHDLFPLVMRNTVYWTIGSTIAAFAIGLLCALLVNQKLPGMRIISGLLVIPYVIGQVTAAMAWRWLLHSDFGVLNQTLIMWGVIDRPIRFLQSPEWVMTALVIVNVWKTFPFCMIMMLAGLQAIPADLYKAAKVDGANAWQRFVEITVPQLMPVIVVTTILSIIGNFNSFTIPWVMTGGGPAHQSEIIITWIYATSFQTLRFGFASAISVVLFLILFAFSFIYVRALTADTPASN